jgi:hypothetical protein
VAYKTSHCSLCEHSYGGYPFETHDPPISCTSLLDVFTQIRTLYTMNPMVHHLNLNPTEDERWGFLFGAFSFLLSFVLLFLASNVNHTYTTIHLHIADVAYRDHSSAPSGH